jgi:hypothetical protein
MSKNSLIRPYWLLPIHATEASSSYFHLDASFTATLATGSTSPTKLLRASNVTYDSGVADLEAAGTVSGRLGRYLRVDTAELVPPPAVQTQ